VVRAGVNGRTVRSAKATVPFLARLIGQGVVVGPIRPSILRYKVPVPVPHWFDALVVMVKPPGLVGMPEIIPVMGSRDKPLGRKLTPKLVGLWFAFSVMGWIETPVVPPALVWSGVKFGA